MRDPIRQLARETAAKIEAGHGQLDNFDSAIEIIEAALRQAQQEQREQVEQMQIEANRERQLALDEHRMDDARYFAYRFGAFSDVLATLRSQEIPK